MQKVGGVKIYLQYAGNVKIFGGINVLAACRDISFLSDLVQSFVNKSSLN